MNVLEIQRAADRQALNRNAVLAEQQRRYGVLRDPEMVHERSVLGSLPLDIRQPTPQDMRMGTEQVMNMMPMAGITAFHGSPHLFNKFDMSKIGTGEGAQAYGHGLYFAEKQGVAKDYKERLSDLPNMIHYDGTPLIGLQADKKEALNQLERAMNIFRGPKVGGGQLGFDDAVEFVKNKFKDNPTATKFLNEAKESSVSWGNGNLYKVDIPDDQIAKMLDWDKPLSKQPKSVMDAIDRALPKSKRDELARAGYARGRFNDSFTKAEALPLGQWTGKDVEWALGRETRNSFGGKYQDYYQEAQGSYQGVASLLLKEQGIPGIKYLDQGSRQGGKGTSNFVLFDDQIPQILAINDKPVRGILSGQ